MLILGYLPNILLANFHTIYGISPTSMSQHSTLYTLSTSFIACNDTSDDDGDDRGSSGDSTTGGSEDGSSTSLSPPSEHWLLHWRLVACIPVWDCKHPGNICV